MEIITIKLVAIFFGCWFIVLFGCLCIFLYAKRRERKKQLQERKKIVRFEQRLRKMSDLDFKLWLAVLRKGYYSGEYNSLEMRQVIRAEMRRRRFVHPFFRSFKT